MQGKKKNSTIKLILRIILIVTIACIGFLLVMSMLIKSMMKNVKVDKQITITTDGNGNTKLLPDVDEENIDDSRYRDSIEEAVRLDSIVKDKEDEYTRKVDEIIFEMESDDYKIVFFRSIKDQKYERFTFAKFKKKEMEGQIKYAYLYNTIFDKKKGGRIWGDFKSLTEDTLRMSDIDRDRGVEPGKKRFLWGVTSYDDVYRMKIEGQEPTEIIAFDVFGKENYFWYYEDIQSDKLFREMELTVDE